MKGFPETEALMLRLINLLADSFPGQAILKGDMELRLLNCPRFTNDLDYIFIPFTSKKEIAGTVLDTLRKDPALTIEHSMHSTCHWEINLPVEIENDVDKWSSKFSHGCPYQM